MPRSSVLVGSIVVSGLVLSGCASAATFTIEGSWQFPTSAAGAVWAAPCEYPDGSVTVRDDRGQELGVGELTHSAYGLVDGHAVCNAYFKIDGVPEAADSFLFSVPGYDDPTAYSRDEVDLVTITSP